MSNRVDIDFVVPWVDDSDPIWRAKKAMRTGIDLKTGNNAERYRDWETLKYWFRGVEKFAPWVRYVYFVTDEQKPAWLNIEHPKLKWVKHTDYIPQEYLPTFSSHTIEWNLHRIEDLSEHFVYFNDDVFLIRDTRPEDFFVNGQPCDFPGVGPLYPNGMFSRIIFNNIELLNRHFSLRKSVLENPLKWLKGQKLMSLLKLFICMRSNLIPNSAHPHIQTSIRKSSIATVWEQEFEWVQRTCESPVRTPNDISIYCARDWQIFSGDFYCKRPIGKAFLTASLSNSDTALKYLQKQKGKIICLNDSEDELDFDLHKQQILEVFEKLLPEKSSFEL